MRVALKLVPSALLVLGVTPGPAAAQEPEPCTRNQVRLDFAGEQLRVNDEGWYRENPMDLKLRLRCPRSAGDLPCTGDLSLDLDSPDGSTRFLVLENGLQSDFGCKIAEDDPSTPYTQRSYGVSCLAFQLLSGQSATYTWKVWVQPNGKRTLTARADWNAFTCQAQAADELKVPAARVRPVVFVHGILGSMPPGNTVVETWPQQLGDTIDWSLGPHLDPFVGSYKPIIDNLLKMGYEIGKTALPVTYDWRRSNVNSAAWLRKVLSSRVGADGASVLCGADDKPLPDTPYVRCDGKADVVVHSMGGLVLRSYIADLASWGDPSAGAATLPYQRNVAKAIFVASPHRGFPFDYVTLHGQTWKDYQDGQVQAQFPPGVGALLGLATDKTLWPFMELCHYRPDPTQECNNPIVDWLFCSSDVVYGYSRANPFDSFHPGIGSLREMIPEAKSRAYLDGEGTRGRPNYLRPTSYGREPNFLLDTLDLNGRQKLRTLRRVGRNGNTFDGIYVIYSSDWDTAFRYEVQQPASVGSAAECAQSTPGQKRWCPGGEVPDPANTPGILRRSGDGLIPAYSMRLFYDNRDQGGDGGLLAGRLPSGARLIDHELRVPGVDHVLIMGAPATLSSVGAILTGMLPPARARANPGLFPITSEYTAPLPLFANADVLASFVSGCPCPAVNPLTGLCEERCTDPAAPWLNPDSGQCEACPADTPEWDPELRICKAACPGGTQAGGDAPVTRAFELGSDSGTFNFCYEHFTVKDRMIVRYEDQVLHDTGCVSGNATVPLTYSGDTSLVVVEVVPNCEGTTGTAWRFRVACPGDTGICVP
jgi:hypothetical protein